MKISTNAAKAGVAMGASVGMLHSADERSMISGVFTGFVRGFKPEHDREGSGVFRQIMSMRAELDALFKMRKPNALNNSRIVQILDDLEEAEAYIDSLREVRSEFVAKNLVTTVGKNYLLDNGLAGSSYTAAFYLGLISSTSYTAVAAGDTMASHAGWLEAGNANAPTYSGNRKTAAWSSASAGSKSLSAGLVFTASGSGTVKGCFLTTVNTVDGTTGSLYSAGTFTGGDQPVVSGNTLTVSYTASL